MAAAFPAENSPEIRGTGSIGAATPIPTADRQDFELDIAWDLTGRLFYRDWTQVRVGPVVLTITIDASADPSTFFSAFRNSSTRCADPARGTEIDGLGRTDTGDLIWLTVVSCDNGPAGSGDAFRITAAGGEYERAGTLSSGDLAKSGTTPATENRVSGLGAIGTGPPTLGSDRQEFDFDLNATPGGRFVYSDYSVVRSGAAGRMVVDPSADGATELRGFHQTSTQCVRISGVGRIDTGDLLLFYIDVCDKASPGAGVDTFVMTIPDRMGRGVPYVRSGSLATGDILLGAGAPPAVGTLNVTTSTTGSSLDPNGYTVTVNGNNARAIPVNGTVTYTNLASGSHTVALTGVATNCTVSGGPSRTVTVPSGGTISTTFAVSCSSATATALVFTVQPSNARAGSWIQPAVQVRAVDSQGNPATFSGLVTIAIGRNGGLLVPGTLSGTMSVYAVNGVATFGDLGIDQIGNGYTLRVTASGLAGAESASFNVTL